MPVLRSRLTAIPPRSGTAFHVPAGATLRVIDPEGGQVADLVAFASDDRREALSNGRTFDYASSTRIGLGSVLYSNRSRPLLTVVRDDVGVHDFLLTPCSRDTWRLCYGHPEWTAPGCHGNLATSLARYGIAPDAIPTTLNLFMNVVVGADGSLAVKPPVSKPGDAIELRAETDLVVGLTACSAPDSCGGRFGPIAFAVLP